MIEHFIDLKEEMDLIHNCLTEDGKIVIGVPDVLRAHKYYGGNLLNEMIYCHNYSFSFQSLSNTLSQLSFTYTGKHAYLGSSHYLVSIYQTPSTAPHALIYYR